MFDLPRLLDRYEVHVWRYVYISRNVHLDVCRLATIHEMFVLMCLYIHEMCVLICLY